ncbi:hypothetical protein [Pseudomonas sp. CCC2.2]|uniref:hypothetical protein n=1 Tax=Pseudomonas sp. CCC2.2 TaxID=3048605 RepID=UPI002B2395CA|nr:hypothetical protein [Pseudomonas sp. CCC2.2]MEB0149251.1 hypothetical protein [Pseudomonas sp. CCC2.2]
MHTPDTAPLCGFQEIHESAGMRFLNQVKMRSFSLNIFQMNALELMEETQKIRDPDVGLFLMSHDNQEAGDQAHRELSRHIHNFVASSKTLVDHTRVFITENYANTEIQEKTNKEIEGTFLNSPVSKFVHDLRNYMLHKGLPNSHMFLSGNNDPDNKRGMTFTTGIRFDTKSLLEYTRWTAPAKRYIEEAGEHIDIHQFTEQYLAIINKFHTWLDLLLSEHHKEDLVNLAKLQNLYYNKPSHAPADTAPETTPSSTKVLPLATEDLEPTPGISESVDTISDEILSKIRRIIFPERSGDKFPTQRPISATITDEEMFGIPISTGPDINGEQTIAFIKSGDGYFGLAHNDFNEIESIIDKLQNEEWAKQRISRQFIKDEFISWAQSSFNNLNKKPFSKSIFERSTDQIKSYTIWLPIAHLEVEVSFDLGPVKISPITLEFIDNIQDMTKDFSPSQSDQTAAFFKKIRHELQGLAAVVVPLEAEHILAEERALALAQDAVNILRFFSPTAPLSDMLCPTALLGTEIFPHKKIMTVSQTSFSLTDGILASNIYRWRISKQDILDLESMGITKAASLICSDELNNFAQSIRSAIITYSKGSTVIDPIERLHYALSALEEVYLRHSVEPIESKISRRTSLVLSNDESSRAEVAEIIRKAYRLKGQYKTSAPAAHEQQIISLCIGYTHEAIRTALLNINSFHKKLEFIEAVDRL